MKIEKLSIGSNKIYLVIGFILAIILIIIINIFLTKSKYRVTESIQIVSGDIYYAKFDYKIMKVYLQNKDKTSYIDNGTEIPTSGYKLRPIGNSTNDSYCTINNVRAEDVTITYNNGQVTVNSKRKGAKCYLYFDINPQKSATELLDDIKEKHKGSGTPNFANTSCSSGCDEQTNGIYETQDDFGTSYYYRGTVDYNWVKFGKVGNADIWWRIIRFNGNGTIRLIYAGTSTTSNAPAETGDGTQLSSKSWFNTTNYSGKYVKYMYGNSDSTIKQNLDVWFYFTSNLNEQAQLQHIDTETGFCSDGDENDVYYATYYPAYYRLYSSKAPSLKCGQANLFTKTGTNGNNKLTYPVGLITADEIYYAGETSTNFNQKFYLYTGQDYWTLTPSHYNGAYAFVFMLNSSGVLGSGDVGKVGYGVRPVINLKADTQFKDGGDGTKIRPYEVVI